MPLNGFIKEGGERARFRRTASNDAAPESIQPDGPGRARLRKLRRGGMARVAANMAAEPPTAPTTELVRRPSALPASSVWAGWVPMILAYATERACGNALTLSMMR